MPVDQAVGNIPLSNIILKSLIYMGIIICLEAFVALLFYVHGKHLRSCRDGQLT